MSEEKCKYCGGEIGYIGMPYGFTCLNRNCITHNDKEFIQALKQQLKAAKEENEYRDNMLCEQIEIWRSNCDVWMNQSNKFEQQNKQMRENIGKAEDIARTYQDYRPCLLIKKELQQALNKGVEVWSQEQSEG